jgi:TPR repeat protein
MKTTVYRGGDVAEQTEAVFVDRNHRVEGENKLREKWRAKWKAAWKEGRIIDDLTKEEFILNPDLERRFFEYHSDIYKLFYSENLKDRAEAVIRLRRLAFAGSSPAYYDLIFRSHDSSYEEDNKLQFYKLFGNMFNYSFMERPKTEVSNEMIILAKDNPNNNTDQNELIRSLLLLSQKKFQHYNHLINIAGADMFLSYMIFSMPGAQSDAKTEYYLAARFDRNEIGEITDYLLTNEEIVSNLEKEAEEGDVLSIMFLVNMHNPKGMYKTLKQIVPQNAKKAIYYSKKIIEHIKARKDDVDIKKSPSLARKAYETLRELKDESMLKEVNIYFKDIDEAKANRQKEIRKQGQFCTVSFMEGDKPKRKVYTYYKTENCLAHIKHAAENGYLDKGRFKNGNNPLIFWGRQGTYGGTKSLMKNHKPLTRRTAEEKFKVALDIWRGHRDEEALEWFEEAANDGYGEAANFMSEIYKGHFKNHKIIKPDKEKYKYWIKKQERMVE